MAIKEFAAKQAAAGPPERFGNGADRADPATKRFAEDQADSEKTEEQKHPGRVDGRHLAGQQPILQVHEASNRQPTFDAGRPLESGRVAGRFEMPDEQVELSANPDIQRQETELHGATQRLRAVRRRPPHQFIAGRFAATCFLALQHAGRLTGHYYQPTRLAHRRL